MSGSRDTRLSVAVAYQLSSSASGSRDTPPSPVQQPILQAVLPVGQPVEQQGALQTVVEVQPVVQHPAGPAVLAVSHRLGT